MIFRYTISYVKDVSTSLEFFERAFGFQRSFLQESGHYGELSTGETKLAFSSTEFMRQTASKAVTDLVNSNGSNSRSSLVDLPYSEGEDQT